MNKELKFDHFKNIDELLQHIDIWYKEDDIDYTRWFHLEDLKKVKDYITNLQQENKQLKEELKEANDNIIWWSNRFNAVERDNRQLKNEIQLRIKSIEKLENDIIGYQRKIQTIKRNCKRDKAKLRNRIDKANEYINNTSYFDGSSMCANDLLEILGDKDE